MNKIYFIMFLTMVFTGCSIKSNNIQEIKEQYPNWYINPPQNNSSKLYGVGEGDTRNEAIKNALESLSSRLMVTISSDTTISSKSYRDFREYSSKLVIQDVKSQIEELSFKNYLEEQSYLFDKKILILLSIDKDILVDTLSKEIDLLYKNFDFINKQKIDPLSLYLKYNSLLNDFYKNYNKAQILSLFIDNNRYFSVIDELKQRATNIKNKINFFVNSDKNSQIYNNLFKDSLVKNGFIVVDKKVDNLNSYTLDLSSTTSEKKAYDFFIIENILNIKVLNSNKEQIASKVLEFKGASSINFEDAKLNLVQKLKKDSEKQNILPFN